MMAASPEPMPAPAETMMRRSMRRLVVESSTVITDTSVVVAERSGRARAKQSTKIQ